jgi:hypothetical protein
MIEADASFPAAHPPTTAARAPSKHSAFVASREPDASLRVLEFIERFMEATMGRGLLLWLLGVPIPVIILLWLFFGR